jgi:hypothetical protein
VYIAEFRRTSPRMTCLVYSKLGWCAFLGRLAVLLGTATTISTLVGVEFAHVPSIDSSLAEEKRAT